MYLKALSLLSGLAVTALAQSNPFKISQGFEVIAGKSTTISWTPTTDGPVSLTLRNGVASDLNKGTVIASSIPNTGSYTFTVPDSTAAGSDYALQIAPVSNPIDANYTPQFALKSTATGNTNSASNALTASQASSLTSELAASTSSVSSASADETASVTRSTSSVASSASRASSSSSASSSRSSASTSASPAPSNAGFQHKIGAIGAAGLAVMVGAAAAL